MTRSLWPQTSRPSATACYVPTACQGSLPFWAGKRTGAKCPPSWPSPHGEPRRRSADIRSSALPAGLLQLIWTPVLQRQRSGSPAPRLSGLLVGDEWPLTHWTRQTNKISHAQSQACAHFRPLSKRSCRRRKPPNSHPEILVNVDVAWGVLFRRLRKDSKAGHAKCWCWLCSRALAF